MEKDYSIDGREILLELVNPRAFEVGQGSVSELGRYIKRFEMEESTVKKIYVAVYENFGVAFAQLHLLRSI
eukprot:2159838-Ditylum_brightwellii.AAC.1